VPRLFTPPARVLSPATSRGFQACEFAERVLGLRLFPWQKWLLVHLLELNEDGTFRFRTALVVVARQNGKTTLLMVLFLWRLYCDGARLVIGTAQTLEIAEETWSAAVDLAQSQPELNAEIEHVDRINGKKALRLFGGARYKVSAATRRGGRSLTGDLIGLDELREHQNWESWAAVSKTTMARPRAQIVGFSNAGDRKSVVLTHFRAKALKSLAAGRGGEDGLGLFEWSAPEGCDLDDVEAWQAANPSLGLADEGWASGVSEAAIRGFLNTDPEDVFRTEVLCQWVDDLLVPIVAPHAWDAHKCPPTEPVGPPTFAYAVHPTDRTATICVAHARPDGRVQLEITGEQTPAGLQLDCRHGTEWVAPRLLGLAARHGVRSVTTYGAAAESLRVDLERAGLAVVALGAGQLAAACGAFYDGATAGAGRGIAHLGQPELTDALMGARRTEVSHGWRWAKGRADLTPLFAATCALWGHLTQTSAPPEIF